MALNVGIQTATILLCIVILYIRDEGRAQLGDSPAPSGADAGSLGGFQLVVERIWRVQNSFTHTPGTLAGMAVRLASKGPSLHVDSMPLHIVSPAQRPDFLNDGSGLQYQALQDTESWLPDPI